MENREKYIEYVDACGEVRHEINSQLYDRGLGPIKKLSEEILGLSKPHYKLVHDMLYYKGGYPKEDSPPRLNELLDRFISLYKYFELLGHAYEIESYLATSGISITLTDKIKDEPVIFPEESTQRWESVFPDENVKSFDTTKKFLAKLLDRSLALQEDICHLADTIKIDTAEKVEEECKIKKPYFLKAVSAKAKQLAADEERKKKEIGDKVQEDADNHEDAVSIF